MNKAIDVWHQPFTPELMKKAYVDAKEQHDVIEWWGLSERVRGRTPKQFVSDMDEIGVDKVMIPASKFKSYKDQEMQWNFTIEEIFNIIKEYPDRLYGLYGGILKRRSNMPIPWNKGWQKVEGYDYDDLIYEKKYLQSGGVAKMMINRPEKLNAFTGKTIRNMYECVNDINMDPSIGVVILTGAGDKAFCTGGDVESESEGEFEDIIFLQCNNVILACKKPIIAVVKGWAVGGGNHMAYCCDLTIAADNARFAQGGPRVGSPATGWFVQYAERVIGAKRARELWMLCRRYDAQQALAMGLVNAVVPLDKIDEEVDKWCEEILEKSPTCIQLLKATFDDEFTYRRFDESMDLQKRMFPKFQNSEEQKEAQSAFFEKRKPNFLRFLEKDYDEYVKNRKKISVK